MDKFLTKSTNLAESNSKGHRKALSPIQMVGNEKLSISEANSMQNAKITKACLKPTKKSENTETIIYEDPVCNTQSVETACVSTQTASLKCECACHTTEEDAWAEKEAYRLMVQDEIPADYWKDLAEARRAALEEALIENKELHEKLSQLEMEKDALSELASHADYFASVLKKAINYDDSGIVADETINSQGQDDTEDDEEEEKEEETEDNCHEN